MHIRYDAMTGEYGVGRQPGRTQRLNIGVDGAKPRVAVIKTVVDGVNQWHTASLVPEADGVALSFEDVYNPLHQCDKSPYQATAETRLMGV